MIEERIGNAAQAFRPRCRLVVVIVIFGGLEAFESRLFRALGVDLEVMFRLKKEV